MCTNCQCNHNHDDVNLQDDLLDGFIVSTIFGTFTVPDEDTRLSLLEDEKDALNVIRRIQHWRSSDGQIEGAYGLYKDPRCEETLYFDMDNVWIIAEDENGEEYEEYIDLDGDIIIAAYRYLHNEPHMSYPWLEKYVD